MVWSVGPGEVGGGVLPGVDDGVGEGEPPGDDGEGDGDGCGVPDAGGVVPLWVVSGGDDLERTGPVLAWTSWSWRRRRRWTARL